MCEVHFLQRWSSHLLSILGKVCKPKFYVALIRFLTFVISDDRLSATLDSPPAISSRTGKSGYSKAAEAGMRESPAAYPSLPTGSQSSPSAAGSSDPSGPTASSIRSGTTSTSRGTSSRNPQDMNPHMMEMIERLVQERVDAYNRPPEYEPERE
jgi:hypothetical protein